ncbi:hypothetical protein L195_g055238, partial [Trifolium pratense]
MEGDQPRPEEGTPRLIVDISWVANEARETPSIFSGCTGGHKEMFYEVEDPSVSHWEIRVPPPGRRICSNWGWGTIPVYQIIFEHMGYRLPFTDLEVAVFRYLRVTPSQLHPNSMAFLRAFQVTCKFLNIAPTLKLFFHAFFLQRSCPKGEKAKGKASKSGEVLEGSRFGWVSFRQRRSLFRMYEDSIRGFKERYYAVRPITSEGWKHVCYRGAKRDARGEIVRDPSGAAVEVDYGTFPF